MYKVTNLDRRRRWEDPISGTIIPPGATVELADAVVKGLYFQRATMRLKPALRVERVATKKPVKKVDPPKADPKKKTTDKKEDKGE